MFPAICFKHAQEIKFEKKEILKYLYMQHLLAKQTDLLLEQLLKKYLIWHH